MSRVVAVAGLRNGSVHALEQVVGPTIVGLWQAPAEVESSQGLLRLSVSACRYQAYWRDGIRRMVDEDFEGVAYLNCAYVAPMPKVGLAAARASHRYKARPDTISDDDFFDLPDAYRAEVAALIGAEPRDVAVADSTIHVVSTLTAGLDWRAGDEVLIPADEFPSNRLPWLALGPAIGLWMLAPLWRGR